MRTLGHYLSSEGAMSLTALSVAVGISKGRLSQLRDATELPADLALNVERETGGAINASDFSSVVARARAPQAEAA